MSIEGHGKPCYYCEAPCNTFAGNPGKWPIAMTHADAPGVVKWHHEDCVHNRLDHLEHVMKLLQGFASDACKHLVAALEIKGVRAHTGPNWDGYTDHRNRDPYFWYFYPEGENGNVGFYCEHDSAYDAGTIRFESILPALLRIMALRWDDVSRTAIWDALDPAPRSSMSKYTSRELTIAFLFQAKTELYDPEVELISIGPKGFPPDEDLERRGVGKAYQMYVRPDCDECEAELNEVPCDKRVTLVGKNVWVTAMTLSEGDQTDEEFVISSYSVEDWVD